MRADTASKLAGYTGKIQSDSLPKIWKCRIEISGQIGEAGEFLRQGEPAAKWNAVEKALAA